jgi:alkaline phosphatase
LTDKPLYSPSFSGLLSKILTNHTYLGWTTGGHTGEEVFLACYNPNGIIPLGMNTNVELSHYMQALFGMYGKMDQFTDKIFTHHDIAFKGYDYKIEKPSEKGQYPKLIVKNKANGKIMTIEAFTNIATLSGTENKVIEIPSVMPYVDRTGKFYVPSDMAQYLK